MDRPIYFPSAISKKCFKLITINSCEFFGPFEVLVNEDPHFPTRFLWTFVGQLICVQLIFFQYAEKTFVLDAVDQAYSAI